LKVSNMVYEIAHPSRHRNTHKTKFICIQVSKISPFLNAGVVSKNLRLVSMVTPLVN